MYAGPPLQETIKLLSPLTELEELNLGDSKLGGTITADVAVFAKLKKLSLYNMDLDGKSCMFQHICVVLLLTFHRCFAGELPKELGNLVNLTHLWLNENEFQGELYVPSYMRLCVLLTCLFFVQVNCPKSSATSSI